jgi:hypothetical protein
MIETLVPLDLKPGFYNVGTTYQAKGRWFRGSLVRFFQGALQPIGGWVAQTLGGVTMRGVVRALLSYMKFDGTYLTVVGTTGGLYVVVTPLGSTTHTAYDITPADLATAFADHTGGIASPDDRLTWSLSSFGDYAISSFQWEGQSELIEADMGGMTLTIWDGSPTNLSTSPAGYVTSPRAVLASFVTPEKFVVALGAQDLQTIVTGINPDARMVWWASQATTDTWQPSDVNSAGSFSLPSQGTLKAGLPFRGSSLIWTTRDLWSMTYIGQPLIYSFQQIGMECGIISSHAFVGTSNAAFWMGINHFFRYDGYVSPIPCDVSDYVFGNMNASYQWKIWALHNAEFTEVTWYYVSTTATEIDSYVTFNYAENHWVFGNLSRTAGVTAQVPGLVPVLTDAAGTFWNHETGTSKGGASTYCESGPVEIAQGDQLVRIQRIVPDDQTLGDVTLTLFTSLFPDQAETSHGPYAAANPTNVRVTGRQARIRFDEYNAVAWRVGTMRLGVIPVGRR